MCHLFLNLVVVQEVGFSLAIPRFPNTARKEKAKKVKRTESQQKMENINRTNISCCHQLIGICRDANNLPGKNDSIFLLLQSLSKHI